MTRLPLRALVALSIAVAAGAATSTQPWAQAALVKQRQDFMKAMGDTSKEMRALVATPDKLPQAAAKADELATKAKEIPALFKPGSEGGDALPAVYSNPQDFAVKASRMSDLAMTLAAAARSNNVEASTAAFGALGRDGCGACHQTYRKKED